MKGGNVCTYLYYLLYLLFVLTKQNHILLLFENYDRIDNWNLLVANIALARHIVFKQLQIKMNMKIFI